MRSAVLGGAGATATALGASATAAAAEVDDTHPITIPKEFEQAKNATLPAVDFPMSGRSGLRPSVQGGGCQGALLLPGQL